MSIDYKKIASNISQNGSVRTAGKIEFIRDQGPVRRDIRVEGYEWSPDSLRNLAKILWAAQRSHSYASAAMRLLSRMPSSQFSPDGLMGGRGYIQSVKDLRTALASASETLSNFTDTVFDEINAEHWSPASTPKTETLIKDAENVKVNPDQFVENELNKEGVQDFLSLNPTDLNPVPSDFGQVERSSSESDEPEPNEGFSQQASGYLKTDLRKIEPVSNFESAIGSMLKKHVKRTAGGPSSLPTETLPGPRVDHIGPAAGGEYGWFNGPEAVPSDDPSLSGFLMTDNPYEDWANDGVTGYDAPTDGDQSFVKKASNSYSMLPGASNDRLMPIYTPGLTHEEIDWMLARAAPPDPTKKVTPEKKDSKWLWGRE